MLPKWHLLSGFLFAYIIYWFTSLTIFQASLIFFASVLIDVDHYIWHIQIKKDWNLKKAYAFSKKICQEGNSKPIMHIFHTIEFIILIAILSFYFNFFIFILIGILFHSILDVMDSINRDMLGVREFSLIRYLILNKKHPKKYF